MRGRGRDTLGRVQGGIFKPLDHLKVHIQTVRSMSSLAPDAPMPWKDPEYVRFVQTVAGTRVDGTSVGHESAPPSEVYTDLMSRERRALDTVDRVVNDARKTELRSSELVDLPVRELAGRAMVAGKAILDDLVQARDARDVGAAMLRGDRKVFVGAALVTIALFAAFLSTF